jgi:hypothetical protein
LITLYIDYVFFCLHTALNLKVQFSVYVVYNVNVEVTLA